MAHNSVPYDLEFDAVVADLFASRRRGRGASRPGEGGAAALDDALAQAQAQFLTRASSLERALFADALAGALARALADALAPELAAALAPALVEALGTRVATKRGAQDAGPGEEAHKPERPERPEKK